MEEKSEFISLAATSQEIERYCISKSIHHLFAVYGMSMGGVLAAHLWQNRRLTFEKVILESSPILSFEAWVTRILTKQYLSLTQKARARDERTVQHAINSMVTEDMLDEFLKLLDGISDDTIKNYLREVGSYKLPTDINTPNTQLFYFYGGKMNEFVFRNAAKYLKKHYENVTTVCLKGKGHCEDALLHPKQRIKQLDQILNYERRVSK